MTRTSFPWKTTLAGLVLSAFSAMAQTATPVAQQTLTTGMVQFALGQTAQLNVLNLGPSACSVQLSFHDATNKIVETSGVLTPGPGTAVSFSVYGSAAITASATSSTATAPHPQVRGVVQTVLTPAASSVAIPVSACSLVTTLEVFDATGAPVVFTSETQAVPTLILTPATSK